MNGKKHAQDSTVSNIYLSKAKYKESLAHFDASLSEGCAVSQAISGRMVHPSLGYATHVYTRILAHGRNLIGSVPLSRWFKSDYEDWDFGVNAGNVRSILEAALLFHYLYSAASDPDTQKAVVQLMHLYDLTKRIKIIHNGGGDLDSQRFRAEIVENLKETQRFNRLPKKVQADALKGGKLMLETKSDIMARLGWVESDYNLLWNLTSQYVHVQSLAFYRIEPNGRGTGIENDFDRGMLAFSLEVCSEVLRGMTDVLCEAFPDAIDHRNGINSKFSPGPVRNSDLGRNRAERRRLSRSRR